MDRYYRCPERLLSIHETEENNYLYKFYEADFDNGTVRSKYELGTHYNDKETCWWAASAADNAWVSFES
jgi:hypothetical protein